MRWVSLILLVISAMFAFDIFVSLFSGLPGEISIYGIYVSGRGVVILLLVVYLFSMLEITLLNRLLIRLKMHRD